ncbi:DUF4124 domain-containing protein [Telluria aromaticivorans]|uniref:DUF4124 domain-containing protein n=1 Tax=Telluria aromaticivorans TaxID=2725995 RepID=A0A7Y2K2M8_9BURK|nr:DUF4124 domain-containing protein [Telluria aromaticivorans]NNG25431.1 DUF4124 domain-containing protein [Telluria aromaticivorans]
MLKHISMGVICLLAGAASAATIYKCTEGGKVSYNDRPCGATAVVLAAPSAPGDPAATAEAVERIARERALLQGIEKERAARAEQQAGEAERSQRAAALERRRCDKLRLQRKWADEDIARAGRDEAERARLKARRQGEALAVECPA